MAYEPLTDQETGGMCELGTKLGGKKIHCVYHCTLLPSSHLPTHLHSPPTFPSHTHLYSPPTLPHTYTLLPSSHLTHTRSSFLQLVLKNTCPLPIALTDPMIATELELTNLHEEMPAVSSEMGVAIWKNLSKFYHVITILLGAVPL